MPYDSSGIPNDGGAALAIFGTIMLIIFLISIPITIATLWAYGTLLKAALNIPKVMVLLLLIPFVNLVMPIVWGVQAHNALKEREVSGGGGS